MYLDFDESNILMNQMVQEKFDNKKVSVTIFPSSIVVADAIKTTDTSSIQIGAQNVTWNPKGAYTGEVSPQVYRDLGCTYALVGHSERRYIFGETNDDVRKKMEACLDAEIIPVLCIGETAEDKEQGKSDYRIKKQLGKALEGLEIGEKSLMIAYEPVWAVGTGEPCDPVKADEMHMLIKEEIKQYTEAKISILYGGSVNEENVVKYLASQNIDGVLVGAASAKLDKFARIISAAEQS